MIMILKIRQAGDAVLRQKSKKLSDKDIKSEHIQSLIDYMVETLRDYQGVGLAAPQVGENIQLVIIEDKAKYHKKIPAKLLKEQSRKPIDLHVLINPRVIEKSKDCANYFEGCLSIDGYRAIASRSKKLKVVALDRKGKPVAVNANGWFARILQHELDHLKGILYIDGMIPKSFMTDKNFSKDWSDKLEKDIIQKF